MEEAGSGAITATQWAFVAFASQILEKSGITNLLLQRTESTCRTETLSLSSNAALT